MTVFQKQQILKYLHQPFFICITAFLCDLCLLRFGCIPVSLRNTCFFVLLLAGSLCDLRFHKIPNVLPAGMIMIWIAFASPDAELFRTSVGASLLCVPVLMAAVFFRIRSGRKGLGGGDLKLVFASGLYLGFQKGLWMLLLSCLFVLLHLVIKRPGKRNVFAFGPFLSAFSAVLLFL